MEKFTEDEEELIQKEIDREEKKGEISAWGMPILDDDDNDDEGPRFFDSDEEDNAQENEETLRTTNNFNLETTSQPSASEQQTISTSEPHINLEITPQPSASEQSFNNVHQNVNQKSKLKRLNSQIDTILLEKVEHEPKRRRKGASENNSLSNSQDDEDYEDDENYEDDEMEESSENESKKSKKRKLPKRKRKYSSKKAKKKSTPKKQFLFYCDKCENVMFLSATSERCKKPLKDHQATEKCRRMAEFRRSERMKKEAKEKKELENLHSDFETSEHKLKQKLKEELLQVFKNDFSGAVEFIMECFGKNQADLLQYLTHPTWIGKGFDDSFAIRTINFRNKTNLNNKQLCNVFQSIWDVFFRFDLKLRTPAQTTTTRMLRSYNKLSRILFKNEIGDRKLHIIMDNGSQWKNAYASIYASFYRPSTPSELKTIQEKVDELENILIENNENLSQTEGNISLKIAVKNKKKISMEDIRVEVAEIKREIKYKGKILSRMIGEKYLINETSDNMQEVLTELLKELKCENQLSTITSDNASSMSSLAEKMKKERFRCLFHVLHLMSSAVCLIFFKREGEDSIDKYENLKFFKELTKLASFVSNNWQLMKILILLTSKGKINDLLAKDEKESLKIKAWLSQEKINVPKYGQFHRFFSFKEYAIWINENLEKLVEIFEYLQTTPLKRVNRGTGKLYKFEKISNLLKRKEEIFGLNDIFSWFERLYDLCYINKGYNMDIFFEEATKFIEYLNEGIEKEQELPKYLPKLMTTITGENEKQTSYLSKAKNSLIKTKEIFKHYYDPILTSSFWDWSQLGNPRSCRKICKEKLEKKDMYRNWITRFNKFFVGEETDISKEPELAAEYCEDFLSINLTELAGESGVKNLKMQATPHENYDTIDIITKNYANKTEIECTPEMISKMKEIRRETLQEEKEKRKMKKDMQFIDPNIEKNFDYLKELSKQKKEKENKNKPKTIEEQFVSNLILQWEEVDKFKYTPTIILSKTNLDRILKVLGYIPEKEWTIAERIHLICVLYHIKPLWVNPNYVFENDHSRVIRKTLDWLTPLENKTLPRRNIRGRLTQQQNEQVYYELEVFLKQGVFVDGKKFTQFERDAIQKKFHREFD